MYGGFSRLYVVCRASDGLVYTIVRGYNSLMKIALTIAGSDPSGGAGIQADLKVFRSLGVYGLSAIAAVTAQNSSAVKSFVAVGSKMLKEQLTALLTEFRPDAIKTGMLYSAANVNIVADIVRDYGLNKLVIDPVIISSSGKRLTGMSAVKLLRQKLMPLCTVITPNISEASVLTGIKISEASDIEKAAKYLKEMGAGGVIITGGHLNKTATDVLFDGEFHYFRSKKLPGEYHGTGCCFSAAVTALLAAGYSLPDAAGLAKRFMNRALKKSFSTGRGMRLLEI